MQNNCRHKKRPRATANGDNGSDDYDDDESSLIALRRARRRRGTDDDSDVQSSARASDDDAGNGDLDSDDDDAGSYGGSRTHRRRGHDSDDSYSHDSASSSSSGSDSSGSDSSSSSANSSSNSADAVYSESAKARAKTVNGDADANGDFDPQIADDAAGTGRAWGLEDTDAQGVRDTDQLMFAHARAMMKRYWKGPADTKDMQCVAMGTARAILDRVADPPRLGHTSWDDLRLFLRYCERSHILDPSTIDSEGVSFMHRAARQDTGIFVKLITAETRRVLAHQDGQGLTPLMHMLLCPGARLENAALVKVFAEACQSGIDTSKAATVQIDLHIPGTRAARKKSPRIPLRIKVGDTVGTMGDKLDIVIFDAGKSYGFSEYMVLNQRSGTP